MSRRTVVYYPDQRGKAPALDFLVALRGSEQQKVFAYISYLEEQGEALRRPIADYLGNKLYELRPGQIRVLYAFVGRSHAIVLHAFRKKTDAVPLAEQRVAHARLADVIRRHQQGLIRLEK